MRLDRFLSITNTASRSESAKAARRGGITVNGVTVKKADTQIEAQTDIVCYFGVKVVYKRFYYVILNKPEGVVSATDDGKDRTVLDLLPEKYKGVFPCGRLDKYTTGLMLLTNDGETAHRLLSPKHHVEKTYRYECALPLSPDDVTRLSEGVYIDGGYKTKPARVVPDSCCEGEIVLIEGKYHQIKQMFGAVGNKITSLKRIKFGPLTLNGIEHEGDFRELNEAEEKALLGDNA